MCRSVVTPGRRRPARPATGEVTAAHGCSAWRLALFGAPRVQVAVPGPVRRRPAELTTGLRTELGREGAQVGGVQTVAPRLRSDRPAPPRRWRVANTPVSPRGGMARQPIRLPASCGRARRGPLERPDQHAQARGVAKLDGGGRWRGWSCCESARRSSPPARARWVEPDRYRHAGAAGGLGDRYRHLRSRCHRVRRLPPGRPAVRSGCSGDPCAPWSAGEGTRLCSANGGIEAPVASLGVDLRLGRGRFVVCHDHIGTPWSASWATQRGLRSSLPTRNRDGGGRTASPDPIPVVLVAGSSIGCPIDGTRTARDPLGAGAAPILPVRRRDCLGQGLGERADGWGGRALPRSSGSLDPSRAALTPVHRRRRPAACPRHISSVVPSPQTT